MELDATMELQKAQQLTSHNKEEPTNDTQVNMEDFASTAAYSSNVNVDPKVHSVLGLFKVIGIDWIFIIAGAIFSAAIGVIMILFFFILGRLFGALSQEQDPNGVRNSVNNAALQLTYVAIGSGLANFLANLCFSFSSQRISNKLKILYFRSVTSQEIGYFEIKKTGTLINSISEDVSKVTEAFGTSLLNVCTFSGQIIAGVIFGLVTSYRMTLLGLVGIPIGITVNTVGTFLIDKLARRINAVLGDSVATANEVMSSMKTVRSMAGEEKEKTRYVGEITRARFLGFLQGLVQGIAIGTSSFCNWGALTLAYWYASTLIERGEMNAGQFVAVDGFVFMTVFGLEELIKLLPTFSKAHVPTQELFRVILRKPAWPIAGGLCPETVTGHISFENITFRYPSRPKVTVLNNFSLEIEAGKSTALVGYSGCGKSTCIGLIEHWYEPEQGSVKLDGVDIREIDQQWLHQHIGIVSQEPTLFATTIRNNITYAVDNININIRARMKRDGASEEAINNALIVIDQNKIEAAAKAANAHDFIMQQDKGYDTLVAERGTSLSGGQKQRIAIARAVLQDPKVLLLDEATSALDTESESLVQDALNKLMHGRTTIMIAHRLSTVQDCDQIVVMREGTVIEKGTHDELLQIPDGVYHSLAQRQIMGTKKEDTSSNTSVSDDEASQISEEEVSLVEAEINASESTTATQVMDLPDDEKKSKKRRRKRMKKVKKEEIQEIQDPYEPKLNLFSFRTLIDFFDWVYLIVMIIASVVSGAVPIIFILLYGYLLNTFTPPRNANGDFIPFPPGYSISTEASKYCGYLAIVSAGAAIAQFAANFCQNTVSERLNANFRKKFFKSAVNQEMGFFDIKKSGTLLNILSEDVSTVKLALSTKMSLLVQNITTCIVGIILSFIASWKITLLMLGVGIGSLLIVTIGSGFISSFIQKAISSKSDSITAAATETIESIRTVRSMSGEKREQQRLEENVGVISRLNIPNSLVIGLTVGLINFGIWGDAALSFWFGSNLIVNNELSVGGLIQTFYNILLTVFGAALAATQIPAMIKAFTSAQRILKVTLRKPQINPSGGVQPTELIGNVEFKNITFAYPARPDVNILNEFNLSIEKGKATALVGGSGSGKSTLVGLIERFYDPQQGTVLLDGVDIREIDPTWLHKHIAIVSQEPVLFATTIRKNITYAVGDENVSQEQVMEAAKAANCHDLIMRLPDQYDTLVGSRGVALSGGQRQRIAIARAMLQNASLLLLDEATSALDTEAERVVQKAIDNLMVGRTSIVIAHRLSTIRECDRIVVMKLGKVVESGTHDELLGLNGYYKKLAMKQMSFGH